MVWVFPQNHTSITAVVSKSTNAFLDVNNVLQKYILIYFLSNLQSRPPNNSRVSNFVSEKVNGWYWVDEFHKSVNVLGEMVICLIIL